MSHLRILAKVAPRRGARSIWLAGTSRPCFLARAPRTTFTTSRRSSVHQGDKINGFEPPHDNNPPNSIYPIITALGFCALAYTMYTVYNTMTVWPKVLRDDLRRGIRNRNEGNLPLSIQHLQQAWETAKSIPLNLLGSDPLLKTSGIAIVLAGVLEDDGKNEEAYKVYKEALWQLQSTYLDLPPDAPQPDLGGMESLKLLTLPERMRAAALAHKLGGLASKLRKPEEEEEKWLTWSVNAILMAVMKAPAGSEKVAPHANRLQIMGADMRLPSWARNHDIAAPFAALGNFYSERGNNSYAIPLYLQAISILIPAPPLKTSPEDRCRGAILMRELACFFATSGGPDAIAQATSWAQKGLDVAIAARSKNVKTVHVCETAYITLLHYLALLQVISGDYYKARELFETVVKEGEATGWKVLAEDAERHLRRLYYDIRDNEDKTV